MRQGHVSHRFAADKSKLESGLLSAGTIIPGAPGVFVKASVTVDAGVGVRVGVEVMVGMTIAVCVRPEEKVTTARV